MTSFIYGSVDNYHIHTMIPPNKLCVVSCIL